MVPHLVKKVREVVSFEKNIKDGELSAFTSHCHCIIYCNFFCFQSFYIIFLCFFEFMAIVYDVFSFYF